MDVMEILMFISLFCSILMFLQVYSVLVLLVNNIVIFVFLQFIVEVEELVIFNLKIEVGDEKLKLVEVFSVQLN